MSALPENQRSEKEWDKNNSFSNQFKVSEAYRNLFKTLRPEKSFYFTVVLYSIGVSLLTLAIPVSVQALVNTIAFGVLTQPLIVLTMMLFFLLILSGVLNAFRKYIIELYQRHVFARIANDTTHKLINSKFYELEKQNGVELINRFFDVVTLQKSVASLLTGGIAIILQTFTGMILLAFYHPYFLVFDLILIAMLAAIWFLFADKAILSSIKESKAKYKTAAQIQEIARLVNLFKTSSRREYVVNKSQKSIQKYLDDRKVHFSNLFIQNNLLLTVHALMSSILLGLGGYLVMKGQLTLGQLVAAELVLTMILSSFSKAGKHLESLYDVFGSSDKISQLYNILQETSEASSGIVPTITGQQLQSAKNSITLRRVVYESPKVNFKYHFDFNLEKSYMISSDHLSSKLVFCDLIQRIVAPSSGEIDVFGHPIESISSSVLRDQIQIINNPQVMRCSVKENLVFANKRAIRQSEIEDALEVVDLKDIVYSFPDKLDTILSIHGHPLWSSQLIRLEIARAILSRPKIVVLHESFETIERSRRRKIIKGLQNQGISIISFSNQLQDADLFDNYAIFTKHKVIGVNSKDEFCELAGSMRESSDEH